MTMFEACIFLAFGVAITTYALTRASFGGNPEDKNEIRS